MKKNNRFVLLPLAIIGSLLMLSIFTGCSQCSGRNNTSGVKPKKFKENAIILLHGLWSVDEQGKNSLEPLQKALKQSFKDVTVIAPSRDNSAEDDIEQQVEKLFKTIEQEKLVDKNLILIGHSQGGLVAFSLYDQYKERLNFTGLITINTPWEGAPMLSINQETITNIFPKDFSLLLNMPSDPSRKVNFNDIIIGFQQQLNTFPGVCDLNPTKSELLQAIQQALPAAKIPILALGSHLGSENIDFLEGFTPLLNRMLMFVGMQQADHYWHIDPVLLKDLKSQAHAYNDFKQLQQGWQAFVNHTGKDDKHDILIPLTSQLAANLNKNKKFKTAIYGNYHHLSDLGEIIKNDQQFYNKIRETIEGYMK
jgi:pimeloyl-ACP methyl ester carboxylesterase